MKNTLQPSASGIVLASCSQHGLDKRFKGEREGLPSRAHQTLNDHLHSWINNPCRMKGGDKGLSHLWGHSCVEGPNFHYSGWNAPKRLKPLFTQASVISDGTLPFHFRIYEGFLFSFLSHNLARFDSKQCSSCQHSGMSVSRILKVICSAGPCVHNLIGKHLTRQHHTEGSKSGQAVCLSLYLWLI